MFFTEAMYGLLDRFQRDVMLNYFVGDVIRRVCDDTQYFVLEPLYDVNAGDTGGAPQLDSVSPNGLKNRLVK